MVRKLRSLVAQRAESVCLRISRRGIVFRPCCGSR
jgi:hypothetical protein